MNINKTQKTNLILLPLLNGDVNCYEMYKMAHQCYVNNI